MIYYCVDYSFTFKQITYVYRAKTYFKDQKKLLHLALTDAFYGQNKCLLTEIFRQILRTHSLYD